MFAVILMLKFSMIENIRISKHVPSSLPHVQYLPCCLNPSKEENKDM